MFPTKEQLENRRWYRLFKVFLYTSIPIFGLLVFVWLGNDGAWNWQESKYIYSFQRDYEVKKGDEKLCSISPTQILCGDLNLINFVSIYCHTSHNIPEACGRYNSNSFGSFSGGRLFKQVTTPNLLIMEEGLENGTLNNLRSKYISELKLQRIFVELGMLFIAVAGWFCLLRYLVYRSIIYVAFGKKSN